MSKMCYEKGSRIESQSGTPLKQRTFDYLEIFFPYTESLLLKVPLVQTQTRWGVTLHLHWDLQTKIHILLYLYYSDGDL